MTDTTHTGKVAIVTGAAHGLGRAMAMGLVDAGASVVAADLDEASLADFVREAGSRGAADRVLPVAADIGLDESAPAIVKATLAKFGRLDILVNNAGVLVDTLRGPDAPRAPNFWQVTPAEFRRIHEINSVAPFLLACAALPTLQAQGWGRIVTVTTSLDNMFRKGMVPYGGSKASTEATFSAMAEELMGTGITVNILVPGGPANTRMLAKAMTEAARAHTIKPELMVAPLLWLTSTATDDITNRRYIAALWDKNLAPTAAAEKAGGPMAWPQVGSQTIFPEEHPF